jgi:hypothetical protein
MRKSKIEQNEKKSGKGLAGVADADLVETFPGLYFAAYFLEMGPIFFLFDDEFDLFDVLSEHLGEVFEDAFEETTADGLLEEDVLAESASHC